MDRRRGPTRIIHKRPGSASHPGPHATKSSVSQDSDTNPNCAAARAVPPSSQPLNPPPHLGPSAPPHHARRSSAGRPALTRARTSASTQNTKLKRAQKKAPRGSHPKTCPTQQRPPDGAPPSQPHLPLTSPSTHHQAITTKIAPCPRCRSQASTSDPS